jgi:CTP:molybdopterin cytidylyltransferase MocA
VSQGVTNPSTSRLSEHASTTETPAFASVILAGERTERDALRDHSGVACKALIDIGGASMIRRVIDALTASRCITSISLSGPERGCVQADAKLAELVEQQRVAWSPAAGTPSTSADHMLRGFPSDQPVLLTTADHPLLSSEIVEHFCREAAVSGCDVIIGLAPYELVKSTYPDLKKTVLRFRDGNYCGCNLFAFTTEQGRRAADFWRRVEKDRKKPLVVIGLLGWWSVIRYRLGWLTLDGALERLSRKLGLRLGAVILPYANAAVDVDSVADYQLVQQYVNPTAGSGGERD